MPTVLSLQTASCGTFRDDGDPQLATVYECRAKLFACFRACWTSTLDSAEERQRHMATFNKKYAPVRKAAESWKWDRESEAVFARGEGESDKSILESDVQGSLNDVREAKKVQGFWEMLVTDMGQGSAEVCDPELLKRTQVFLKNDRDTSSQAEDTAMTMLVTDSLLNPAPEKDMEQSKKGILKFFESHHFNEERLSQELRRMFHFVSNKKPRSDNVEKDRKDPGEEQPPTGETLSSKELDKTKR